MKTSMTSFVIIGFGLALLHCGVDDHAGNLAGRQQAIINGTLETGYVGVGALFIDRALSASISETLASSEISVQWRARRHGRNEHFGQLGK